ncbi:hypothetical protein GCM10010176_104690 [Nonomuraea spiralis]|nr:hypothetical protein GCM10010176_104690 [Nonomuraea spiralis]
MQYEPAQRGLPDGAAREAEQPEFLSNGGCVEGFSGALAGEEPAGPRVGRGVHVRPGLGELEEQDGERFGNRARWVAELEAYLGVVDADVVEGRAHDAGDGPGTEECQAGGDPGALAGWWYATPQLVHMITGQDGADNARDTLVRLVAKIVDDATPQPSSDGLR